ncbi:hypothetical protein [Georgenia muralis]|uniref:DoxX-like protein n=1 Tax=Georgenia muralis TaxID=154117 RepID=A0A3N4Z1Y7_9MICO|nr:hypothetical protein [Georgenia muralis]RPF26533.1 hypothetical protein EDD32_0978 [Georgenia muralis]
MTQVYRGSSRAGSGTGSLAARRVARVAGGMMIAGAGLNAVLVVARPGVYAGLGTWFAELSPQVDALQDLWSRTMGAHPRVWATAVGVGYEAAVGVLALSADPRRRLVGLGGIAAFKAGLLAMGLWSWALPWLAVLAWAAAGTMRERDRAGEGD